MLVYTTIFGRYDSLKEPALPQSSDLRFVCYTDQPPLRIGWRTGSVWEIVPRRDLAFPEDPLWSARWQKHHPPDGKSIWIDSSLSPQIDLLECVREIDSPMVCLPYRRRSCVYEESESARRRITGQGRADCVPKIWEQTAEYRRIGVPPGNGLHLTGLMYRDMDDLGLKEFQRLWWEEMRRYESPRDQIALARIEWETGFSVASFPDGTARQYLHIHERSRVPGGRLAEDGAVHVF